MKLPELTHLQFEVLDILGGIERAGWMIREKLAEAGERKTLPAFYQMMSRLEDAGYVTGSYRKADIDGRAVNERWYKITGRGIAERQKQLEYYVERDRAAAGQLGGTVNE